MSIKFCCSFRDNEEDTPGSMNVYSPESLALEEEEAAPIAAEEVLSSTLEEPILPIPVVEKYYCT